MIFIPINGGHFMKAVVQRVSQAEVTVNGQVKGSIGIGLLVLLGIAQEDNRSDADWLVSKILQCRIFADQSKKMNLSVLAVNGEVLLISQFTLLANVLQGNRPSYKDAASPEKALELYHYCMDRIKAELTTNLQTGEFGAMMEVSLKNDGPVTIVFDSKSKHKTHQ